MKRRDLTYIALIALTVLLIGPLCTAYGTEAAEDAQDMESTIPICRHIDAFEMHQLNFSVGPDITAASFLLDFADETSDLEMVLITPSGASIDSTVGEPITYQRDGQSIYYIIPNPEPGEWIVEIIARDVPETGEDYCAFTVLDKWEVDVSSSSSELSDEEIFPEECEECNSD